MINPRSATSSVFRCAVAAVCLGVAAQAAVVGPAGYTNDFSARPAVGDFSTSASVIAGGSADITTAGALDAYVQNVAASSIAAQATDSSSTNPPSRLAAAQWTSGGSAYLMTRPTGNRATVLMATLVNGTGTNCNMLRFNYQLTVGASYTEEVSGQRLYYSFSEAPNSWTALPAVSGLNANGLVSTNVALNQVWTNGGKLYLLWVDDNSSNSSESAYEIDNFFAAAYFEVVPFGVVLTAPANGDHFGAEALIPASVALSGSPTNVRYFVDGVLAVERATPPFTPVQLPAQALGTHAVYATALDTNNTLATTVTNQIVVDLSLSGALTSDTTLYASNSPYLVSGNLTVPAGVTLRVQPGVTLQLRKNCGITVNGRLTAEGTTNQPIFFTRYPGDLNWERILFVEAADSVFRNCVFQYANCAGDHKNEYYATNCAYPMNVAPRTYFEAVVALACHLDFDSCSFSNLYTSDGLLPEGDAIGIFSDDLVHRGAASAHVQGCKFSYIGQGVHARYAYALVENCYFVGKSGDNDDVELYGESTLYGLPTPIVRSNFFDMPCHDDRIHPTRCSAIISDNIIMGSGDHAIVLRDTCCPIVFNNVMFNCPSGGITVQNGCDALIANNTFYGINSAIKLFDHQSRITYPYCLSAMSGRATVINCVVWNGSSAVDVSGSAGAPFTQFAVDLAYCDIQGGTNSVSTGSNTKYKVGWGPGIINVNPAFVDSAAHDLRPAANSPLIDAGSTNLGIYVTTNTYFVGTTRTTYTVTNDLGQIVTRDYRSLARPLDGNGDGVARFDLGAFEVLLPAADSNRDGIPDGWSQQHGLNPAFLAQADEDSDLDGVSNYQEYLADTDPRDATSFFRIDSLSREVPATVRFTGSSNRVYSLYYTTNLTAGLLGWTPVPGQTDIPCTGGSMALTETNVLQERFYRVGVRVP